MPKLNQTWTKSFRAPSMLSSNSRPISPASIAIPEFMSDTNQFDEDASFMQNPASPMSIVSVFDQNMKQVIKQHNYNEYLKSVEFSLASSKQLTSASMPRRRFKKKPIVEEV